MSYYELVKDDFKVVDGWRAYRIRATQDFENAYRNVKDCTKLVWKGRCRRLTTHTPNSLHIIQKIQ
jgi:CRISPR/Cas system-associated protein Cas5 (RAMP superfamily)